MAQQTDNQTLKPALTPPAVVVFGSGACARKVAANLADGGVDVCLAASDGLPPAHPADSGTVTRLEKTRLEHCHGFAGNYQLRLTHPQGVLPLSVSAVVVAEDLDHVPNHAAYGLRPGPGVTDIGTLEATQAQADAPEALPDGATVVFLCGWLSEADPTVALRMITACALLQERTNITAYFMTGNLKVAADGAEQRVTDAKRCGATFLKFTHDYPTIASTAGNRFCIDYVDELTRMPFRLDADWIVVDETVGPAAHLAALAKQLGIDGDSVGFAQADNVRRLSNATNRRGIFVAGGARGVFSPADALADADRVSQAVMAFLRGTDADPRPPAVIQTGRCARCLTCFRCCPHRAVDIGAHMTVVDAACQRCGLCAAECPARAIDMDGVPTEQDIHGCLARAARAASVNDAPKRSPLIVVFGCARSAGPAGEQARLMGRPLPPGGHWVEVPCGGAVAERHLLAAFEGGADGVMLCVCHNDNCQSQAGNRVAGQRAASVQARLTSAGIDPQRLRVVPLAANMGRSLADAIGAFADSLTTVAER